MRCPKCGYISFDRVERCGKCANDLVAVAAQLRGPMAKVTAPAFLGAVALAEAGVAEAEPAELDLAEAALDLGEMGVEGEAVTLEEEAPAAEAVEEEAAIEMPSLSGIDVSDLMPPVQEAAAPAEEVALEEEIGGIAMPEMDLEEAPAPAPESDESLALNFDLTGGESRGEAELEAEEEAAGGVLDLADLLGAVSEEPATEEAQAGGGEPDDLSLLLDDASADAPAAAEPEQLSLSLEASDDLALDLGDEAAPAAPPAADASVLPDIPDLGLTLESDDEEEPAS